MTALNTELEGKLLLLKAGARELRGLKADLKSSYLEALASRVDQSLDVILKANRDDLERLPDTTTPAFRDRLLINKNRLAGMTESLRQVARLPDPVGEVVENRTLANGLNLRRVRAPLGVIFMIFESRPNVVLEAFSLAFKSGNAICLRGGSDSKSTAAVFYHLMRETLRDLGISETVFFGLDVYDRQLVEELLKRPDLIDIVVPRGGEKLIRFVQQTSLMPIIKNDRGLCHAFVNEDADLQMALDIVVNAKMQRPGVCNSLETVLVHESLAKTFLPKLYETALLTGQLDFHCDVQSMGLLQNRERAILAKPEDWNTEYLDFILNCRVVGSLDEALAHIEKYGSKHSETIITKSEAAARRFQNEVDAAAVYWNASTRFTDGFEMGLGGELGISTQKLHVRGPVGLRELTTPRWIIDGNGQIRK